MWDVLTNTSWEQHQVRSTLRIRSGRLLQEEVVADPPNHRIDVKRYYVTECKRVLHYYLMQLRQLEIFPGKHIVTPR